MKNRLRYVDVFIKELTDKHLAELYENLTEKGYWCINAEELQTISEYLNSGSAVRFAKINSTIPNFEVKFALKQLDLEAFKDFVVVETRLGQLKISSLERQIAYKRFYLKSSFIGLERYCAECRISSDRSKRDF